LPPKQQQLTTNQSTTNNQQNNKNHNKTNAGKQTDVAYQEVAEVRTVPRVFGAWGDMVVVLRNGDKVELLALEKYQELKKYILERRDALRPAGASASSKGGAAARPSVMDLDADDEAVGLGAAAVGAGGKRTGKGFS
jgi:hypothetical protein